jgi:glycosyltransferase involved in cell wall biosynthesis
LKISTVIPVYLDSGMEPNFLAKCLTSVLSQTKKPDQLIICDNSKDLEGLRLAKQIFSERFHEINVEFFDSRKHLGISNNTNFGVKKCQGDIVHVLHQDDSLGHASNYGEVIKFFEINPKIVWAFMKSSVDSRIFRPRWQVEQKLGFNSLGGPSVLIAKRDDYPKYNESLKYYLDTEAYSEMFLLHGEPGVIDRAVIAINVKGNRESNLLSPSFKQAELAKILLCDDKPLLNREKSIMRNLGGTESVINLVAAMKLNSEKVSWKITCINAFLLILGSRGQKLFVRIGRSIRLNYFKLTQ